LEACGWVAGRVGRTRLVGGRHGGGRRSASTSRVAPRLGDAGANGPSSCHPQTGHTGRGDAASGGGLCTAARLGRSPSSGGEQPAGRQGAGGIGRSGGRATMRRGRSRRPAVGPRRDGRRGVSVHTRHGGRQGGLDRNGGQHGGRNGGQHVGRRSARPGGQTPPRRCRAGRCVAGGGCVRRAHARRRCRRRHLPASGWEVDQNVGAASPRNRATCDLYGGAADKRTALPTRSSEWMRGGWLRACGKHGKRRSTTHAERGGARTLSPRGPPASLPVATCKTGLDVLLSQNRADLAESAARRAGAPLKAPPQPPSPPPVRTGNVVQRRRHRLRSWPGRVAQPPPVGGVADAPPWAPRAPRLPRDPCSADGLQRSSRGAGPAPHGGINGSGALFWAHRQRGAVGRPGWKTGLSRGADPWPHRHHGGAVGGAVNRVAHTDPCGWRVRGLCDA